MNDFRRKIVVASHRPWLRWVIVGGGSAALALCAWGLYSYTRATTVSDFEKARTERDRLLHENRDQAQKLRAALADNKSLEDRVAYLSRSEQIDDNACGNVKQSLNALQSQVSDLREQLAFYRGIVSPGESQAGVRVFEFKLYPGKTSNAFRYDLVLIESVRHDKRVDGSADVSFVGYQGGQKQTLKLSSLATGSDKNLVFSFKYFQEFGGEFRFPDGFKPLRATVTLNGDGAGPVDEDFDWAKILQEVAPS